MFKYATIGSSGEAIWIWIFQETVFLLMKPDFDINMRANGSNHYFYNKSPFTYHSRHYIICRNGKLEYSYTEATSKRKIQGGRKRKNPKVSNEDVSKGTTASRYMRFIQENLDILDKYDQMRGFYFILDNAPIHKQIKDTPNERNRDYKCVFLPPYSPELNPIEQFWALVKRKIQHEKLQDAEILQDRTIEAANKSSCLASSFLDQ